MQRKQAGTKLLLKAINVLSLFKINKILLEVNENNEGAIEFYKKLCDFDQHGDTLDKGAVLA